MSNKDPKTVDTLECYYCDQPAVIKQVFNDEDYAYVNVCVDHFVYYFEQEDFAQD